MSRQRQLPACFVPFLAEGKTYFLFNPCSSVFICVLIVLSFGKRSAQLFCKFGIDPYLQPLNQSTNQPINDICKLQKFRYILGGRVIDFFQRLLDFVLGDWCFPFDVDAFGLRVARHHFYAIQFTQFIFDGHNAVSTGNVRD